MIDDAGVVGGSVQQHSRARSISNYDASVSQSAQHSHRHHVNHHHRQIREQKVAAAMQQGPSTLGSTLGTRQRLRTSSSNSSSRSSRRSQHLRVDHGNNRSPVDVQMSPAASPSQHHGHGQHNGAMRIGVMNSPVMPGRPGRSQSDTSSFDIAEYRRSRKIYVRRVSFYRLRWQMSSLLCILDASIVMYDGSLFVSSCSHVSLLARLRKQSFILIGGFSFHIFFPMCVVVR